MLLSNTTVSVGDNVCSSIALPDDEGFKIVCNGDSIGVVRNGLKGDQGEPGKPGDPGKEGSGCTIVSSTDSIPSDLKISVACGSETFTMDLTALAPVTEEDCDGSEECTPMDSVKLGGASQKGPFVKGADVTAYELLNGKSLKQTGKTFGGKIQNDDGSFDIKTVKLASQYAYLVADGYYMNEVTGKQSVSAIKLRALTNLRGRSKANINLVTHLEYDRVNNLVTKNGLKVPEAKNKTEKEIFDAFHIDSTILGKNYAEDLNVLEKGDGNAALLAISILLQGNRSESQLTALLASLSIDLGDDGIWGNLNDRALIAEWAMEQDINGELKEIRKKIEDWKLSTTGIPAFEEHIRNFWTNELNIPNCGLDSNGNMENAGQIKGINNSYSKYFAIHDSTYDSNTDKSKVRLICDAGTKSWRYASDLEKNTIGKTGSFVGEIERGNFDTTSFYYCTNTGANSWRIATANEIDFYNFDEGKPITEMDFNDAAVWHGSYSDTYYVYDSLEGGWRKETTAYDHAPGLGGCTKKQSKVMNADIPLISCAEDDDYANCQNEDYDGVVSERLHYICADTKCWVPGDEEHKWDDDGTYNHWDNTRDKDNDWHYSGYRWRYPAGKVSQSNGVWYLCTDNKWKPASATRIATYKTLYKYEDQFKGLHTRDESGEPYFFDFAGDSLRPLNASEKWALERFPYRSIQCATTEDNGKTLTIRKDVDIPSLMWSQTAEINVVCKDGVFKWDGIPNTLNVPYGEVHQQTIIENQLWLAENMIFFKKKLLDSWTHTRYEQFYNYETNSWESYPDGTESDFSYYDTETGKNITNEFLEKLRILDSLEQIVKNSHLDLTNTIAQKYSDLYNEYYADTHNGKYAILLDPRRHKEACESLNEPESRNEFKYRLPTTKDWETLFANINNKSSAGYALKSQTGWQNNGSNEYYFNVKPESYECFADKNAVYEESFGDRTTCKVDYLTAEANVVTFSNKHSVSIHDFEYSDSRPIHMPVRCVADLFPLPPARP